jgi:hypothetical protein
VQHAQQPRFHGLALAQLGQPNVRADARFLDEILGIRAIAREPVGRSKQGFEVRLDQLGESPAVVRHSWFSRSLPLYARQRKT